MSSSSNSQLNIYSFCVSPSPTKNKNTIMDTVREIGMTKSQILRLLVNPINPGGPILNLVDSTVFIAYGTNNKLIF